MSFKFCFFILRHIFFTPSSLCVSFFPYPSTFFLGIIENVSSLPFLPSQFLSFSLSYLDFHSYFQFDQVYFYFPLNISFPFPHLNSVYLFLSNHSPRTTSCKQSETVFGTRLVFLKAPENSKLEYRFGNKKSPFQTISL